MYEIALERVVEREVLLVDRGAGERVVAGVLDEVRLAAAAAPGSPGCASFASGG